jgi:hypothetical protein
MGVNIKVDFKEILLGMWTGAAGIGPVAFF